MSRRASRPIGPVRVALEMHASGRWSMTFITESPLPSASQDCAERLDSSRTPEARLRRPRDPVRRREPLPPARIPERPAELPLCLRARGSSIWVIIMTPNSLANTFANHVGTFRGGGAPSALCHGGNGRVAAGQGLEVAGGHRGPDGRASN